ncbi:hypothetical protein [Microtetraspora sp. NBRC 13810]|uniref:hypothetical protein n=1 Tax=Microtetraspora sp. NBRC 13810 TaxID=3030990 RepID=UPI002556BF54|nr:hypothetical protein [Microtetraspora sp. NBRC 13810]
MERIAAVLVTSAAERAAPPGVDARDFLTALAEDTYEIVAGLDLVSPAVVTTVPGIEEITWPGTPVLTVPELAGGALVRAAFAAIADALPQAAEAVLVSADAPDLPGLLIGKLFRALGRSQISVCPADGGGAVAVAARLPYPEWAGAGMDDREIVPLLRAAAPGPRTVATGPGWHRLREPGDLRLLDPGLEGWDNTRVLLSG